MPRNQSTSRKGSELFGVFTFSPILTARGERGTITAKLCLYIGNERMFMLNAQTQKATIVVIDRGQVMTVTKRTQTDSLKRC